MVNPALKRLTASALPVVALLLLVLVSLHLMSSALQNTEELSRLFVPLLVASVLGLFALVLVVGVNIAQLVIRYRQHASGSRLAFRMVMIFVVLSLAPVSVVYYYSQQFLLHGIDSWFDVEIDQAMADTLDLSRASLDLHKRERLKSTQQLLSELTGASVAALSLNLEQLREQFGAIELALMEPSGRVVASVNADPSVLVPSRPDGEIIQQVRSGKDFVGLVPREGDEALLEVRVVVSDEARNRILQALYPTSVNISDLTEKVQGAYNRYKELAFLRNSLKSTFTLALALVLLFSLLSAIWAAFFSARRLVAPVADIAEGTRAVAKGDYDMQLPMPKNRDELSFLVSSFNTMTRRIAHSRDQAESSQRQVETQRAYLETVLGRLSSGVMALDTDSTVQTANDAACDILQMELSALTGQQLVQLTGLSPRLRQFVEAVKTPVAEELRDWREQVNLFGAEGRQVLLCRGTPLARTEGEPGGYVLVFDDITTLIKAQRDAAWGEVARRLAHEIKNPLTPIQLSAERLRRKYLTEMQGRDADILDRATHTIVQQVEAMKSMVDDFSDYARPAMMNPQPLVFDQLVSEVLDLYRSAGVSSQFSTQLTAGGTHIEADPVRLRQVVHNLVKNAQEAVEGGDAPWVEVSTRLSSQSGSPFAELQVADNGPGFDHQTLPHLFEPYVTTKAKGTGLGLAVVKKIVEEHGGVIWADNRTEGGACVILRLPVIDIDGVLDQDSAPDTRREAV